MVLPPHIHSIKQGKGDNKLVITVAPQKLICPQGNTYPIKAIAINIRKKERDFFSSL